MKQKKWTDKMSLTLSRAIVYLLAVIFALACVYVAVSYIGDCGPHVLIQELGLDSAGFCVTFYICAVLAFTALFFLNRLLKNVKNEQLFIDENVKILRILSWCCYLVGIVLTVYSIWAYPFIVVAAAAAFFGLILRVLKNVFAKAVEMREENDGTI